MWPTGAQNVCAGGVRGRGSAGRAAAPSWATRKAGGAAGRHLQERKVGWGMGV
jgi:hypothetical protein